MIALQTGYHNPLLLENFTAMSFLVARMPVNGPVLKQDKTKAA